MKTFTGEISARIVSADIPRFLSELTENEIILKSVTAVDGLTVEVTVGRVYWKILTEIAAQRNTDIKIIKRSGYFWISLALRKRPVLLAGVFILVLLSLLLPSRVLFIEVQGNSSVPDRLILEEARRGGLSFGAPREGIRSEKIKNRLLSSITQLQWVGVNTQGCRAVISVTERSAEAAEQNGVAFGNIVAAKDGIIRTATVTRGNALCSVGQAVKKGEVLVSGYTDCGLSIRATGAQGEIFAETLHVNNAVVPVLREKKGQVVGTEKKYSLRIGKKRINFYKDSGIYGTTYDKMYREYDLILPGGFRLPLALCVEYLTFYDNCVLSAGGSGLEDALESGCEFYLLGQMIAGQILSSRTFFRQTDELYTITGEYRCLEMIGRLQQEEIIQEYGQSD